MKALRSLAFQSMSVRLYSRCIRSKYTLETEIPATTLPQFIFSNMQSFEHQSMITCGVTGKEFKFREMKSLSYVIKSYLKNKIGLKPGQVMGLVLPSVPEFPAFVYGSMENGNTVTFVNPYLSPEQISHQLAIAGVNCTVTTGELKSKVEKAVRKLPGYLGTVEVGEEHGDEEGEEGSVANTGDPALLAFTTSNTPVILTHANLISSILQLAHPDLTRPPESGVDKVLNVIPYFHIHGFTSILNLSFFLGKEIISLPKFTPQTYIEALTKFKPTTLQVVPTLLSFISSNSRIRADHLESVSHINSSAAPAPRSLINQFRGKFSQQNITVSQGYGITAASASSLLTPHVAPASKDGSSGQLVPLTDARVVSLKTGGDQPSHQTGELYIKGPQVMKGYLNNEKATKEAIDEEGWLHTGDLVYYDEDEYFYIIDQCRDVSAQNDNQVVVPMF